MGHGALDDSAAADAESAGLGLGKPEERDRDPFDLVGDVLDGQYRVDEFAGEGDFSVVYRGHHLGVDAPIAIKCLNLPTTLEKPLVEPFIETFREGARLHYRLAQQNLHIAQCISFGTTLAPRTGHVVPYLVREWLEGRSLAADLAARRAEGAGPRSLRDTVRLLSSAADGLAFAHAQGLVHHSVNPRNLFVVPTLRGKIIKVLDFGVAKVLNESLGEPGSQEARGLRVLFPAYAAPEQHDRSFGEPCAATDVYAFALIVYEVLAGRPVYAPTAVTSEILETFEPGKRPTAASLGVEIPTEVEEILGRALAIEPSIRHGNVGAFWNDLARAARRAGEIESQRRLPTAAVAQEIAGAVTPAMTGEGASGVDGTAGAGVPGVPPYTGRTQPAPIPASSDPMVTPQRGVEPPLGVVDALLAAGRAGWGWGPLIVPAVIGGFAFLVGTIATVRGALVTPTSSVAPFGSAVTAPSALAPTPPPSATTAGSTSAPAPSSSESLTPSAWVPSVPTGHNAHFDRREAKATLDAASADFATSCAHTPAPRGPGSARIRFDNDGTVRRITLGPPYAGTQTGKCIGERYRTVRVTPFDGPPIAFNYSLTSIPW